MIPEWLKDVAVKEGEKGLWLCEHDRHLLVCRECEHRAIEAYVVAKRDGKLDDEHENKFVITKANGEPLPEGEPYFPFRAQDALAVPPLRAYLTGLVQAGIEGEAIDHMQEHILEFMAWPTKKLPD